MILLYSTYLVEYLLESIPLNNLPSVLKIKLRKIFIQSRNWPENRVTYPIFVNYGEDRLGFVTFRRFPNIFYINYLRCTKFQKWHNKTKKKKGKTVWLIFQRLLLNIFICISSLVFEFCLRHFIGLKQRPHPIFDIINDSLKER